MVCRRPPTALSCDLPLDGLSSCWLLAEHSVLSTQAFTSLKTQIQHYTVDYLAQGSMKNGVNSEMPCELQDTWTSPLWTHIAEPSFCLFPYLTQGRFNISQALCLHWAVTKLRFGAALSSVDWVYGLSTLGSNILGWLMLLQSIRFRRVSIRNTEQSDQSFLRPEFR